MNGTQLLGAYHFHLHSGLMGVGWGEKTPQTFVQGKMSVKKIHEKKNPKNKFMHKMGRIFILNKDYHSANNTENQAASF